MSEELIPINILIGDRTYRIKIHPETEESIRKTVKTVNDKIIEYKTEFIGKDMQDYIAMVMIWLATITIDPPVATSSPEINASLAELENLLDQSLPARKEPM